MNATIAKILLWIKDNLLVVLISALIIPGVLSTFNNRATVTKSVFEGDYRNAKIKFLECTRQHSEYIAATNTYADSTSLLGTQFSLQNIKTYGNQENFYTAFKAVMSTYNESRSQSRLLFDKASRCYSELKLDYENVAIALDLTEESDAVFKSVEANITQLSAEVESARKALQNAGDPATMFSTLATGTPAALEDMLQRMDFSALATHQLKLVELETALQIDQAKRYQALNLLFSQKLSDRFHQGVLGHIWSLVRI